MSKPTMSEDINNTVTINVGGVRHEVYMKTLQNLPAGSRLSSLDKMSNHYRKTKDEYYYDRHPGVFTSVVSYCRTGELHVPHDVCGALVRTELEYWGVDELEIEMCCWIRYKADINTMNRLKSFDDSIKKLKGSDLKVPQSGWQRFRYRTWQLLDNPSSSIPALMFAILSILVVLLSITVFCLETHPYFKVNMTAKEYSEFYGVSVQKFIQDLNLEHYYDHYDYDWDERSSEDENVTGNTPSTESTNDTNTPYNHEALSLNAPHPVLELVDFACVAFFCMEFISRLLVCPCKRGFFFDSLNIIDLLSIVPQVIVITVEAVIASEKYKTTALDAIHVLKVLRVFRIFRLVRHNKGLRVLLYTFKQSWKEMALLLLFMAIGIVLFASLVYYFDHPSGVFTSIPMAFWWAIITMTTVGYGDYVPKTDLGYLVGSMCAVSGVLVIAFTVPTIVNNFLLFYQHVQYEKKERVKAKKSSMSESRASVAVNMPSRSKQHQRT